MFYKHSHWEQCFKCFPCSLATVLDGGFGNNLHLQRALWSGKWSSHLQEIVNFAITCIMITSALTAVFCTIMEDD